MARPFLHYQESIQNANNEDQSAQSVPLKMSSEPSLESENQEIQKKKQNAPDYGNTQATEVHHQNAGQRPTSSYLQNLYSEMLECSNVLRLDNLMPYMPRLERNDIEQKFHGLINKQDELITQQLFGPYSPEGKNIINLKGVETDVLFFPKPSAPTQEEPLESNYDSNNNHIIDPATDQEAIWNQIKERQKAEEANLRAAQKLDNQLKKEDAQGNNQKDDTDWAVIAHKVEQDEILQQIRDEQEALKGTSLKEQQALLERFSQTKKYQEFAQKEQDKADREEFNLRVRQKLEADTLKKQQEEIAALKVQQEQETLKQNIGYTETTSYTTKSYKTFLDFAENIGFKFSDGTKSVVKHAAHGVHTTASATNAYLTGNIVKNVVDVLSFTMSDYTNLKNTEAKCGVQAVGAAITGAITFNPYNSIINSGLTFVQCELETRAAEKYPLLVSTIKTAKTATNLFSLDSVLNMYGTIETLNFFNQVSSNIQSDHSVFDELNNFVSDMHNKSGSFLSGISSYFYGTSDEDSFDTL